MTKREKSLLSVLIVLVLAVLTYLNVFSAIEIRNKAFASKNIYVESAPRVQKTEAALIRARQKIAALSTLPERSQTQSSSNQLDLMQSAKDLMEDSGATLKTFSLKSIEGIPQAELASSVHSSFFKEFFTLLDKNFPLLRLEYISISAGQAGALDVMVRICAK